MLDIEAMAGSLVSVWCREFCVHTNLHEHTITLGVLGCYVEIHLKVTLK